ncbi:MAG: M16 family metallopeptidase, partial [Bryobacteraceae bacterium]
MVLASSSVREIERAVLPNGIRVVTEAMPYVRSVSLGIWVGSGSRVENAQENGISHFLEHMVFKGTKNRTSEEIARSVDSVGGGLDAFTSKELVSFNTKVLDEHLPFALDVLADLVLNPLFREEDIEKEKGVILEEIKMEADQPEFVLHETFLSTFWKGHGLGKPILGTKETVKKFNRDMLLGYYERVYSPKNILITAAGNLDHDHIVDLVREKFGVGE